VSSIDNAYYPYVQANLQRFFPVNEEQSKFLMPYLQVRQFDKKTIILNEGEIEQYLSMVVKGLVRKYVNKSKKETTLQLATEGHLIDSEISYLRREPSLVIIETIEPSTLVSISYDSMQEVLEKMPGANRMGRQLQTAMLIKKDERQYKQLALSTRERFLEYLQNHPHMLQRVPQKYLASYLNIKPETFSRLKHLIRQQTA